MIQTSVHRGGQKKEKKRKEKKRKEKKTISYWSTAIFKPKRKTIKNLWLGLRVTHTTFETVHLLKVGHQV